MLPQKLPYDLMLTKWASELDPVLSNPLTSPSLLQNVTLKAGVNVINHKLGRKLVGYYITRLRASSVVHDEQDTNAYPALTLILVASADVTIDLAVF